MHSNDYKEYKQQIDAIRIFAKEIGQHPAARQGVGIPSFSVALKGNLNFIPQGAAWAKSLEGKKTTEKEEIFSLNKEINYRKILDTSQKYTLGLLKKDEFSEYINKLIYILDMDFIKNKKINNNLSPDEYEKEIEKKDLIQKIIKKYQYALGELRIYIDTDDEISFGNAMDLLEEARELEEKSGREKENNKKITVPEAIDINKNLILQAGFPIQKQPQEGSKQEQTAREVYQIETFSPDVKEGTGKPYIMSKPAPMWHNHYNKDINEKIKGYDLAYTGLLFKNLTFKQLDEIALYMTLKKYERGSILFMEDEEGTNFYIIKTGKVLIYREDKGKEILTLSSGEILGEISFFDRSNYGITAKIYSEGTVIVSISQNDFKNILMKYPWVSQNLNLIYAQRLRDLYNKLSF